MFDIKLRIKMVLFDNSLSMSRSTQTIYRSMMDVKQDS